MPGTVPLLGTPGWPARQTWTLCSVESDLTNPKLHGQVQNEKSDMDTTCVALTTSFGPLKTTEYRFSLYLQGVEKQVAEALFGMCSSGKKMQGEYLASE